MFGFASPIISCHPPASAGGNPHDDVDSALKGMFNEIISVRFPRHECLG